MYGHTTAGIRMHESPIVSIRLLIKQIDRTQDCSSRRHNSLSKVNKQHIQRGFSVSWPPLFPYLFQIVTDPQRDGCSPVSVSRYSPISCIFKPVPKTLLPHKIWNPVPKVRKVFFYDCIPPNRKLIRMFMFDFTHKTSSFQHTVNWSTFILLHWLLRGP